MRDFLLNWLVISTGLLIGGWLGYGITRYLFHEYRLWHWRRVVRRGGRGLLS